MNIYQEVTNILFDFTDDKFISISHLSSTKPDLSALIEEGSKSNKIFQQEEKRKNCKIASCDSYIVL